MKWKLSKPVIPSKHWFPQMHCCLSAYLYLMCDIMISQEIYILVFIPSFLRRDPKTL